MLSIRICQHHICLVLASDNIQQNEQNTLNYWRFYQNSTPEGPTLYNVCI